MAVNSVYLLNYPTCNWVLRMTRTYCQFIFMAKYHAFLNTPDPRSFIKKDRNIKIFVGILNGSSSKYS